MNEFKVSGSFDYKVLKADGSPTGKEGHVKNEILDNFLTIFAGATSFGTTGQIHVGTGAGATTLNMTALQSKLANVTASVNDPAAVMAGDGLSVTATRTYTGSFAVGAVVGTITEVGLSATASTTVVHTRALIKDGNGNPTTVTVLADEQLVITYYLKLTFSTAQSVTTVDMNIKGTTTSHTVTALPDIMSAMDIYLDATSSAVTAYSANGTLGAAGSAVSGATNSVNVVATHVASGSGLRRWTATLATTQGNFAGGIGYFRTRGFKYKVEPPIAKDSVSTFAITFQFSIARA